MNFDYICHCGAHITAGNESALALAVAHHHKTIHARIEELEIQEESDRERFEKVFKILRRMEHRLERLEDELGIGFGNGEAQSATLVFQNSNGGKMDTTAHVSDAPLKAVLTEFDGAGGTGNKVPPSQSVQYTSSDPTVATVDAATGQLAYLKAGATTVAGLDPGNGISASSVLTLIADVPPPPPPAVSASLDFVTP